MANPATSIVNPAGEEILLFFVDGDKRLALQEIPIDPEQPMFDYDPLTTPGGSHITNQSIAAVSLRGLVRSRSRPLLLSHLPSSLCQRLRREDRA